MLLEADSPIRIGIAEDQQLFVRSLALLTGNFTNLGSAQTSFNGFEIKLGLGFYNIQDEVHLSFLHHNDNVPGLTGSQPYTFIGFTGGFPIDLTKKSN